MDNLKEELDKVIFRCFEQGQYLGTELDKDYEPENPIDRTEANNTILALFESYVKACKPALAMVSAEDTYLSGKADGINEGILEYESNLLGGK